LLSRQTSSTAKFCQPYATDLSIFIIIYAKIITLKFVGKKNHPTRKKIDLPKMTYISKAYNAHAVMQKIAIIHSPYQNPVSPLTWTATFWRNPGKKRYEGSERVTGARSTSYANCINFHQNCTFTQNSIF
jgi:hypothetical protein